LKHLHNKLLRTIPILHPNTKQSNQISLYLEHKPNHPHTSKQFALTL
jgi:hypothetical protein